MEIYFNQSKDTQKWESHTLLDKFVTFLIQNTKSKLYYSFLNEKSKPILVKGYDCHPTDCEILIYCNTEDSYKLISYSEGPSPCFVKIIRERNSPNDIIIGTHFHSNWGIRHNKYKIFHMPHGRLSPYVNYENFYWARQKNIKFKNILPKAYFRCATGRPTEKILYLNEYFNDQHNLLRFDEYLFNIIKYTVGLSIPCQYEIAHRDFEYMSVGLPLMRTPIKTPFEPQIKANHHYISIDLPDDKQSTREEFFGGEYYADLYIKKFLEIKNNNKFLTEISNNAIDYVKIFSPNNIINLYKKYINHEI